MNCVGVLRAAERLPRGSTIVTVLCDGGQRYLRSIWRPGWEAEGRGSGGGQVDAPPVAGRYSDEARSAPGGEICGEISGEIGGEIGGEVGGEVGGEIGGEVGGEVGGEMGGEIT